MGPQNQDWPKQQELKSQKLQHTRISLGKSNTSRGQKMGCDTSLWQLQLTQKKSIWGYFLHRQWREARLHTPVPWLATKLHCRQTKLVNHKAAQKKRVREPVLVLASSVS